MAWIKIGTKTTDENGKVIFDNLPYRIYKYQQTSAKEGYTLDGAGYNVTINSADSVFETKTNTPEAVESLKLTKISKGYLDLKLAGSKFQLTDSAGKTMLEQTPASDANGVITLENLMTIESNPQSYNLTEVEAPSGYGVNVEDVSSEITPNVPTEITVENTPAPAGTLDISLSDPNYTAYSRRATLTSILNSHNREEEDRTAASASPAERTDIANTVKQQPKNASPKGVAFFVLKEIKALYRLFRLPRRRPPGFRSPF